MEKEPLKTINTLIIPLVQNDASIFYSFFLGIGDFQENLHILNGIKKQDTSLYPVYEMN